MTFRRYPLAAGRWRWRQVAGQRARSNEITLHVRNSPARSPHCLGGTLRIDCPKLLPKSNKTLTHCDTRRRHGRRGAAVGWSHVLYRNVFASPRLFGRSLYLALVLPRSRPAFSPPRSRLLSRLTSSLSVSPPDSWLTPPHRTICSGGLVDTVTTPSSLRISGCERGYGECPQQCFGSLGVKNRRWTVRFASCSRPLPSSTLSPTIAPSPTIWPSLSGSLQYPSDQSEESLSMSRHAVKEAEDESSDEVKDATDEGATMAWMAQGSGKASWRQLHPRSSGG